MKTIFYLKDYVKEDFSWQMLYCLQDAIGGKNGKRRLIKSIYNSYDFKTYALNRELKNLIKLVKEKFLK